MISPLPCPFCGSVNVSKPLPMYPMQVSCIDCGAEGPAANTAKKAGRLWDGRDPNPRLAEARRILAAIIDDFDGCGADHLLRDAKEWLEVSDV